MNDNPVKVLLVDDSSDYAWMLHLVLTEIYPNQFELTHINQLEQAVQHLQVYPVDVILLDLVLPDSSGYETFTRMQAMAPQIPIVVMTAEDDRELALRAVREGAQDFLVKGDMDVIQLVRSTQYAIERHRKVENLKSVSLIDELTGLLDARGFELLAGQQIKIAHRAGRSLLIFLVDLDNLDQVNEQYGHLVGDQLLRVVAALLRETFRSSDPVARLRADDFAVVAIDAPQQSAPMMVHRLQEKIDLHNQADPAMQIHVTIGTTTYSPENAPNLYQLVAEADQMLRYEKERKRPQERFS